MQTLSDQLGNEIIPALYDVLPSALPEFGFVKTPKGYKSTTTRKVSGTDGDRKGAVSVLEGSPYYLGDWREGGRSIYSYIRDRENLGTHRDVVAYLASLAGIALKERELTPEEEERIRQANRQAEMWEAANDFFINCLSLQSNVHAKTPRAESIRDYLSKPLDEGGRGYDSSVFCLPGQTVDRERPGMELGFIPDIFALRDCLIERGFENADVTPLIRGLTEMPDSRIGKQNVLTFPYRDHIGRIKGMVFRSIVKNDPVKYLYSPGLKRNGILFNLRSVARNSDLVVVESPLDAIHASALGIKNIVALGGSGDTLNKAQVDLAIRYGATKITLMLDNDSQDGVDRAGAIGTDKAVAFLQKEYPSLRIYVGQYPDEIKDLDELLVRNSNKAEEAFYRVKDNAVAAWRYQLDRLLLDYSRQQPEGGYLNDKQIDSLLTDIVQTAARLNITDQERFIKDFTSDVGVQNLGITRHSITETVDRIKKADFQKEQTESLQTLLRDARKVGETGEVSKALDLLRERSTQIKSRDKADSFAELSVISTEQRIKERISNRPESLESGYVIDGDSLLIPAAAISILAGSTSHGKSILIANLALNLAQRYPHKNFHIFTYEVDQERYLLNLLNPYIGDEKLAFNNRESLEHYFRGKASITRKGKLGQSDHTYPLFNTGKQSVFDRKRVEFFVDLIETGRLKIHYVTYDSDTLIDAIRHLNRIEPIGAVLIDYMQLIYTPAGKMRNPTRQEEIKQMCIDFKDLALETGLPLIYGAQFNREVNNLAQMHATKLGEAGDLERIADLIVGIWNNSRKYSGTPSKAELTIINQRVGEDPDPNTWYVEILKRRGGKVEVWDIWDYLPNAAKVVSSEIKL